MRSDLTLDIKSNMTPDIPKERTFDMISDRKFEMKFLLVKCYRKNMNIMELDFLKLNNDIFTDSKF